MTQEERRILRENKKAQRDNERLERKLLQQEERGWKDMLKRLREKDALVDDIPETLFSSPSMPQS